MIMDKEVEVVSVSRATEFATGKDIYSIQFGSVIKRNVSVPTTAPPTISVTATIFVDFKDECPYKVGSKWILSVSDKGIMSIKPVR